MKPVTLHIDGLDAQVVRKRVKHINLRVLPPLGAIRISAPARVSDRVIEAFVRSKLSWIKRVRHEISAQGAPLERRFCEGSLLLLWGQTYPLLYRPEAASRKVCLADGAVIFPLSPMAPDAVKGALFDAWHREEMHKQMCPLIDHWQGKIGVNVKMVKTRRMKSRWGSCTPARSSIRLNLELVHHPVPLLEYVVVHELAHMVEASHNAKFLAVMDQHLPDWRVRRHALKSLAPGAC